MAWIRERVKQRLEELVDFVPIITSITGGSAGFFVTKYYLGKMVQNLKEDTSQLNIWDAELLSDAGYVSAHIALLTFIAGMYAGDYLVKYRAKHLSKSKEVNNL